MSILKKWYDNLYFLKSKEDYKQKYENRRKDFIHKYILFFLNPYKNTRHEIVKKMLPKGETYLDIGCWTGDSTIFYGVFEKFKKVIAVEISQEAAKEARKKGIDVFICDLNSQNLPFSDNTFDCITCIDVIEHLIEPYHILQEIKRVLRPEGTFIIGTANVASFSNRIRILFGRRPRTSLDPGWDGGHLLYFTTKELKILLEEYGFKIVEKCATGNLQLLRKLFFNLTGEFIYKCKLKND